MPARTVAAPAMVAPRAVAGRASLTRHPGIVAPAAPGKDATAPYCMKKAPATPPPERETDGQGFLTYCPRSSRCRILPTGVFGRSSRNTMCLGTL